MITRARGRPRRSRTAGAAPWTASLASGRARRLWSRRRSLERPEASMRLAILISTVLALAGSSARADDGDSSDGESQHGHGWRLHMRAQARSEYNDNVFFLSPT